MEFGPWFLKDCFKITVNAGLYSIMIRVMRGKIRLFCFYKL